MMHGYDHGCWSWAWGFGVVLLLLAAFLLGRYLAGPPRTVSAPPVEDPLEILRRRYVRGELDDETYRRMRSELER